MTNTTSNTFTINMWHMTQFEAKLAEANKIAKRLGLAEITYQMGKKTRREQDTGNGKITITEVELHIEGTYPSFNGWSFMTKLDHNEGLVKSYGDHNHRHLVGDTTCHHCNTNRARANTYVITNGEIQQQVGGSCLKYYIPTKSINTLGTFYDVFCELLDESTYENSGGGIPHCYDLHEVLAWSSIFAEDSGRYISGFDGTRMSVESMLNCQSKYDREYKAEMLEKYDFDKALVKAAEINEWAKNLEINSDFISNVSQVNKNGYVTYKSMGFAVATISAWLRAKDDIKKREVAATKPVSEHVGAVKKRENFTLVLENVIVTEGFYGATFIHKFIDLNGNEIMWFGTKRLRNSEQDQIEKGEKVTVKATVKTHDEYKGVKQTIVQRVAYVA